MMANFQKALNIHFKLPKNGSLDFSDEQLMRSYTEALTLSASTTFLVGLIQVLLCFIGVGYVTTYLSETLMNAYLTAAALHVIISQFSFIFGIVIDFRSGPLAFFYNLVYYCIGLPKANATSILLFLLSLLMLRISKCIKITYKHCPVEFPMELVLIIAFTILSSQMYLYTESSKGVFKMVPQSFLHPTLPDFSNVEKIVLHALSLAIVSYFLLIFVGKKYANIHNYHIRNTQATEIQGVKIFQCCSSISSANMKHFKNYILQKMNMKAVPLDENEMRALISVNMPILGAQNKDLYCACVCEPPEPLPRVPYTEKLLKRVHMANESPSSSSLALIRWTKIGSRYTSETRSLAVQGQYIQPPIEGGEQLEVANRKDVRNKLWYSSEIPLTRSTTQLYPVESDSSAYLIHTIILDFSMVHFVDLQASYLLRELCHVFQNVGITLLIAACHPIVIKSFEKNRFFDYCVTKARFFPTLHDAVLYAVEPVFLQETASMNPNSGSPEEFADVHLENEDIFDVHLENEEGRSKHSGRSQQSDRKSIHSTGNRDTSSVKTVRSETYFDEPISDVFRTFSLQSDVQTTPHPPSPLEETEDEKDWGKKWKYTSDI